MKRDIAISVGLHVLALAVTLWSSPLEVKQRQFDDIIRVSLVAAPAMASPEALPPPVIPQAVQTEPMEIPIDDPDSAPKVEIDEPEEKPPPVSEPEEKPYQPVAETGTDDQTGAEEGASEVETDGGSPFAGTMVDNASFDYPYWFTQAFYKIQSNWRNPVSADYSIVCAIYFQVLKSGRVIELRVEESSGVRAYDEACLRAVERSAPFPPLPRAFPDEIIGITLPFKYEP